MTIYYSGDERLSPAQRTLIERSIAAVLAAEGLEQAGELSLSLVSAAEIQQLNAEYRGKDAVTDVLSFPQVESLDQARTETYLFLGDIVINLDQVALQAAEYGHSEARELAYLTVHSMYHLLGFDHEVEADKQAMRQKEEEIMQVLEEQ